MVVKAVTSTQGAVPYTYVSALFEYLGARDIDAGKLLGEAPPDSGDRGLGRYPAERWRQLLQIAALYLNDPLLGLKLGQTITPAHFGVMGYVISACANLAAALTRVERYQRLIYDVNPMRRVIVGNCIELHWGVEHGRPGPLVDECAIVALIQLARSLTSKPLAPQFVSFVNAEPGDIRPYTEFFGCPVRFDQPETVIQFPLTYLGLRLCQPDPTLVSILEKQADMLLANIPGEADDFEQSVRRRIAYLARQGEPSLERVANELHLSPRTLRRKLKDRNQQFRVLRDDTLRRMAEDYLADQRLTLSEIALLLGYSEQSAFCRSFTRWVGRSPGSYRRQLHQTAI